MITNRGWKVVGIIMVSLGVLKCYCFIARALKQPPKQLGPPTTQRYRVSAYCPCEQCCGEFADGITASGYRLKKGDKLCASPLPFGTILDIPGYGVVPVLDRGGAIKGSRIDIFFDTHEEALDWGIKYLPVKIKGE